MHLEESRWLYCFRHEDNQGLKTVRGDRNRCRLGDLDEVVRGLDDAVDFLQLRGEQTSKIILTGAHALGLNRLQQIVDRNLFCRVNLNAVYAKISHSLVHQSERNVEE